MVVTHVMSPLCGSHRLSGRRVWRTKSRGLNYLHQDVGARKAPWLLTVLFRQYYCYSHPNNNICVAMMTDSVKLMERRQYSKRHEDEKTLCGWIIFVFFNNQHHHHHVFCEDDDGSVLSCPSWYTWLMCNLWGEELVFTASQLTLELVAHPSSHSKMVMMITVYDDFYSITYFNFLCYDEIKNLFDEDILLLIIIWLQQYYGNRKDMFCFSKRC